MRVLVLCNPTSGGGRAAVALPAVESSLVSAGLDLATHRTASLLDARITAEKAAASYDVVVAMGGDGTVGACAAGLLSAAGAGAGAVAALGIVPAGGGNDAASALGLPTGDPVAAATALPALVPRRVDLARVGDHVYLDIAGAGFDSEVNRLANRTTWLRGKARYAWAVVAQLALSRPARFSIELDGTLVETDAWFVAVANGRSYGAGVRIAPEARMDDGLLDVVVVAGVPRLELLRTFPKTFSGAHAGHRAVSFHRAARVVADADPSQWVYADGEPVGRLPAVFEALPGAVTVLASPAAPALAPPEGWA